MLCSRSYWLAGAVSVPIIRKDELCLKFVPCE